MNKYYSTIFLLFILWMMLIVAASIGCNFTFQSAELSELTCEGIKEWNKMEYTVYDEINKYMKVLMKEIPVKGLALSASDHKGKVFSMQYGEDIHADSTFALGSTSKAITATATLMVFDEYHLNLKIPVNQILPWTQAQSKITVLDLLNHTSGISVYETLDNLKYKGRYGTFEYSNANYNLLGKIIEVLSVKTYYEYIKTHIFMKLNMEHSFALTKDTKNKVVQGYKTFYGIPIPCKLNVPDDHSWIQAPSGYICSSADDMNSYLQYLLSCSFNGLDLKGMIDKMGVSVSQSPAIEGIYQDSGIYGLGFICKNVNGTDVLYHTGKLPGYSSLSVIIPDKNLSLSVVCNMGDFLVGTNLLEKYYEGIISLLIHNHDMPYIQNQGYWKQHLFINAFLFLLTIICLLPAVFFFMKGGIFYPVRFNISLFILLHIAVPFMMITLYKLLGIPYNVIIDFAPDIFISVTCCSFILLLTGIWKMISIVK